MARKKDRSPEEIARREKIRELLQLANVGSMDDIHELFKETIGEFMENGLEAELDEERATASTTTGTRPRTTAGTGTAQRS